MATEQEMCDVINNKKSIVYTYKGKDCAVGEREGEREGDPHILFRTTKSGSVIVQIWKTGEVKTDKSRKLPSLSNYRLSNITIVRENGDFTPQETQQQGGNVFNLEASMYDQTICSVY